MTILIGLLCERGAVLGADQSMSATDGGLRLSESPTSKITVFDDGYGGMATAGPVGAGQIARAALKALPRGANASKWDPVRAMTEVQKALAAAPHSAVEHIKLLGQGFNPEGLKHFSRAAVGDGIYVQSVGRDDTAVPAVVCYEGAHAAVVLEAGKVIFNTAGSGSVLAQPYMSVIQGLLFPDRLPSIEQGLLTVYWTLRHVIESKAGGGVGGKPDLAVLEFDDKKRLRMRLVDDALIDRVEHMFDDLNDALRTAFRAITEPATPAGQTNTTTATAPPPELPK